MYGSFTHVSPHKHASRDVNTCGPAGAWGAARAGRAGSCAARTTARTRRCAASTCTIVCGGRARPWLRPAPASVRAAPRRRHRPRLDPDATAQGPAPTPTTSTRTCCCCPPTRPHTNLPPLRYQRTTPYLQIDSDSEHRTTTGRTETWRG